MRKPKISFRVIGDSGPLSISWFHGPKGDAIEAKNEIGVGFFSPNGELLAVEFDDVSNVKDHQILKFDRYYIKIDVINGKVTFSLNSKELPKKEIKSGRKKNKAAA